MRPPIGRDSFGKPTARRDQKRQARVRQLAVESLEGRELLAVTATLISGVLSLTGTSGDDVILVATSKNLGEINYGDGTGIGSQVIQGVSRVVVDALDGNDLVNFISPKDNVHPPVNGVSIQGGLGDDKLQVTGGDAALFPTASYAPTGPTSGTFTYNVANGETQTVTVAGFEVVEDTAAAGEFLAQGTSGNDVVEIYPGPTLDQNNGLSQGPVFIDGGDRDSHGSRSLVSTFTDWQKTGAVNSYSATDDVSIPEGLLVAEISNRTQVSSQVEVETSLGLNAGDLDPEPVATNPSLTLAGATAIYRTLTVNAGDTLTFDYTYYTEYSDSDFTSIGRYYPDVAFVSLASATTTRVDVLERAADLTASVSPTLVLNSSWYARTSGSRSKSITFTSAGTYKVGLGTTQAGYNFYDSGLVVDNVRLNNVLIAGGGFENPVSVAENVEGWKFIEQAVHYIHSKSFIPTATKDMLVIGADDATMAFDAIDSVAMALGLNYDLVNDSAISSVNFSNYRMIYVPSNWETYGGIDGSEQDILAGRRSAIQTYVRNGGGLVALTDAGSEAAGGPYSWLEIPQRFEISTIIPDNALYKSQAAINAGFTISDPELTAGTPYHNIFTGPVGFNGLTPFVYDSGNDGLNSTPAERADDNIVTLGQAALDLGGGGGDTFAIKLGQAIEFRIGRKTNITVDTGNGNDYVDLHGNGESLSKLIVGFNLLAGSGRDLLSINDQADTLGNSQTVYPTTISGVTTAPVTWSGFETLSVTGTSNDDNIDFDFSGGTAGVQSLLLYGGPGSDQFGTAAKIIPPAAFNLQIDGGIGGADVVHLNLQAGNSTAVVDATGGKVIAAGGRPLGFAGLEEVEVDTGAGITPVLPGELYFRGTPNAEIYTLYRGVGGNDVILRSREGSRMVNIGPFRPSGRIVVDGLAGNDYIEVDGSLGPRSVMLLGGAGRDTLLGGGGNDILIGNAGDDRLSGRGGADVLWGDSPTGANPRLGNIGDGNDVLNGDAGNDTLIGGGGNDFISGGTGDDYALGGLGNDITNGDDGNDLLRGDLGNDILNGGNNSDILVGSDDQDMLNGGAGRDLVLGGDGADTLNDTDSEEDILLSERTKYDIDTGSGTNRGAPDDGLTAILTEWLKVTTLAARISNIRLGGGANGGNRLSTTDSSVISDSRIDTITASLGSADWLLSRPLDRRLGTSAADVVDLL